MRNIGIVIVGYLSFFHFLHFLHFQQIKMGEYFLAVILSGDVIVAWLFTHDYDSSLEIHDHFFVGNPFMNAVEGYLYENRHKQLKVVWASDYAPNEANSTQTLYSRYHSELSKKITTFSPLPATRCLVNHTKKQSIRIHASGEKHVIHPLPGLTQVGEDSTDYLGNDQNWLGDYITVELSEPIFA